MTSETIKHFVRGDGDIKSMIKNGQITDIDVRDNFNRTALMNQAKMGNLENVKFLLTHDPPTDINAVDKHGNSALHYAVLNDDNLAIVRYLLKKGANKELQNIDEETALEVATENMRKKSAIILGMDSFDNIASFVQMDEDNNTQFREKIKYMLEMKKVSSIDVKDSDYYNYTALMYQIEHGTLENMNALLTLNPPPNLNIKNIYGQNALHCAAVNTNEPRKVELLIKHGANVLAKDENGHNALELAIKENNNKTANLLKVATIGKINMLKSASSEHKSTSKKKSKDKEASSDESSPKSKSSHGKTSKNKAAASSSTSSPSASSKSTSNYIRQFVQNPDNLNMVRKRSQMLTMLEKHKVDINVRDPTYRNYTALIYQTEKNNIILVRTLLNAGADPNILDDLGENAVFKVFTPFRIEDTQYATPSPLITALPSGVGVLNEKRCKNPEVNIDILDLLLSKGARKDIRNKFGQTPLMIAKDTHSADSLVVLLLQGKVKPGITSAIQTGINEKYISEYISPNSPDKEDTGETSPRTRYRENLTQDKITMMSSEPGKNNLFRLHIPDIMKIFGTYSNLSRKAQSDCAFQILFASGILDRNPALSGSKGTNIIKHFKKEIAVSITQLINHITSVFQINAHDLKPHFFTPFHIEDAQYATPSPLITALPSGVGVLNEKRSKNTETPLVSIMERYLKEHLDNDTCTFVLINFDESYIGHYIIAFKHNDNIFIFDPQLTAFDKSSKTISIFNIVLMEKIYSMRANTTLTLSQFAVFLLNETKHFPEKKPKMEYCASYLPIFARGGKTRKMRN
jgi:ankyrin repeat protein